MTKDSVDEYGWGNFKNFKKEFEKREWFYESLFPDSLFGYDHYKTKIHASIVKFDNKGMLLNPIAYLKMLIFKKKYINENFKSDEIINWDELQEKEDD